MSDAEEDSVFCFICELKEEKQTRVIECVNCNRFVHFKCKKIYGNAVTKARKKPFLCSVDCTEMHMRIHRKHECEKDDTVMNELKAIAKAVLQLQKDSDRTRNSLDSASSCIRDLINTTKQVEASQVFLSSKFEELQGCMKEFKSDVGDLKTENTAIKQQLKEWQFKHQELATTVGKLEADLDRVNRESISKNAIVLGIPASDDENLIDLLIKLGKAIGYELGANAVVSARRLRAKNTAFAAPILVSFTTDDIKEQFIARKLAHGNLLVSAVCENYANCLKRIIVRDEMTSYGKELLSCVKDLQTELDIKYVWPGRGGKVLIRRFDGGKVEQIGDKQQASTLSKTVYKRRLNTSAASAGSSPLMESSPKRKN